MIVYVAVDRGTEHNHAKANAKVSSDVISHFAAVLNVSVNYLFVHFFM